MPTCTRLHAEAQPGQFPSIGVVFYRLPVTNERRIFCGASLIRPTVLLLAGHCVADDVGSMLDGALIGTVSLNDTAAPQRNILVRED